MIDEGEGRRSRRRWFRAGRINLADVAVATFSVVLGVLIALAIDDWSKTHERDTRLMQARTALREEMQANRAELLELLAYYDAFGKAAAAAPPSATERNACQHVDGWHGFRVLVELRGAYDTALATGLFAQMDFAESRQLSTIYSRQAAAVAFMQRNLDWYVEIWSREGVGLRCDRVFNDVRSAASSLLKYYDAYLDKASPAPP